MQRAVFLDRDGTINIERDYLFRCGDFAFIAGVPAAIKQLNTAGFLVIVVTNQSGVARGYYSEADVDNLHNYIQQQLSLIGAHVDAFYYCPHHPDKGIGAYRKVCSCRKGEPGMLLTAAAEHSIDLASSFIVGDKLADVQAGLAAGCKPVLVLTGYGAEEQNKVPAPTTVCADLPAAVRLICATEHC
jgi:D-glycero-D-manno-heptose 1,7-bisphosphate phosphatase